MVKLNGSVRDVTRDVSGSNRKVKLVKLNGMPLVRGDGAAGKAAIYDWEREVQARPAA